MKLLGFLQKTGGKKKNHFDDNIEKHEKGEE